MANAITIDASALSALNFDTYVTEWFAALADGEAVFYGGEPDSFYGSEYLMNGSQIVNRYLDAETLEESPQTLLLDGADFAYDFIHYGAEYGHGFSGTLDEMTFGLWTDDTTGEPGVGPDGAVSGLYTELAISGFGLTVEPGTGSENNPLSTLYAAGAAGDADAFYAFFDEYKQVFEGTDGVDVFSGGTKRDKLWGGDGDDYLRGMAWRDKLVGGDGDDTLIGGKGADKLKGGQGDDILQGGKGPDTFVFKHGGGADAIVDFETEKDILKVNGRHFDFDGIMENASQAGDDVLIELQHEGFSVTLENTALSDLSEANFLFA